MLTLVSKQAAYRNACKLLNCSRDEICLERDEDVLDTWFSSGLFPFSVMGWPDPTDDLKAFYPTSLLETGLDILFFWVARMVMMGLELTDTLPFHTVFLHAMVRDKEGRKMSKSLGNVIDPLEVIYGCSLQSLQDRLEGGNLATKEIERAKKANETEFPDGIPECGSDALRFGLLAYTVQGRDISLDVTRVVGFRLFCNKLWNATRFALQFVADFAPTSKTLDDLMSSGKMEPRDKFMISKLMKGVETVNDCLTHYRFGDAQQSVYSLWIDDICAVYLELIKPVVYDLSEENKERRWAAQATLWVSMEMGLRLLHPMMPFVTEELWQRLPGRGTLGNEETVSIMIAKYPEVVQLYKNDDCEVAMAYAMKVIEACRSLRASYNIAHKVQTNFFVKVVGPGEAAIREHIDDIKTLGKAASVSVNAAESEIVGTVVVDDTLTVLMDVKGLVDYKVEISRLQKSMKSTMPAIQTLAQKMAAEGYGENVPEDLKETNKKKLESLLGKKSDLEEAIANLEKLQLLDQ
jgi:valyl-tRNA synthetase